MKTVRDFNLKDKRVLLRCDFNVPLDKQGKIISDLKIRRTLPTIEYLKKKGASIILLSHRSDNQSMDSAFARLAHYIDIADMEFLDNIRLDKREQKNSIELAKELASLADIYINDAFGVCHRKHASIVALAELLPSGAGLFLKEELDNLVKVLKYKKKPYLVIIGGAKIASKSKVIPRFLKIADQVLIGGKIGFDLKIKSKKLYLPLDYNKRFDIGPKTIIMFTKMIKKAKLIVWAGPLGKFEDKRFAEGTKKIAFAIAKSKATTIVGGGNTIVVLKKLKLKNKVSYLSTGGGAMLAFLSGEKLVGLKSLNYYGRDKKS